MVDDKVVADLPADPLLALKYTVAECANLVIGMSEEEIGTIERKLIKLLALSVTVINKHSLYVGVNAPQMEGNATRNVTNVPDYFQKLDLALDKLDAQNLLQASLSAYEGELNVGFHYEFSDGEIERLQALINELREAIVKAGYFDEDHKGRLLGRLEKLQAELHKRVSDLDLALGVIVQIGAAAGRFGEDAKPLVDRVREIAEIVAGVFRRAEKLPPGPEFPLLRKSDDADE